LQLESYRKNFTSEVEEIFSDFFEGKGFRVMVRHHASRDDIFRALHAPSVVGLFWVAHSMPNGWSLTPGVDIKPELVDSEGWDVTDVFRTIHPNLRWLGLVACDSDQIVLRMYNENHHFSDAPKLRIAGFSKVIDAKEGLRELLKRSERVLNLPEVRSGYEGECSSQWGYPLKITRLTRYEKAYPAVTVQSAGIPIASFPALPIEEDALGERAQERTPVWIATPEKSLQLDLIVNSGVNYKKDPSVIDLGRISIEAPWTTGQWHVFGSGEKPLGVYSNIYKYEGSLEFSSDPQEFQSMKCGGVERR
jgi:hypothetical protein